MTRTSKHSLTPTSALFAFALLTAAIFFFAPRAEAGVTTSVPDCGYLNARPCTPIDNEAYNIYFGFSTQCDFGLYVNIHNKCVPTAAGRDTISKQRFSWAQWALIEQRSHVGANTPINLVSTFGTHNSYSSYDSGFHSIFTTDQRLSIYDQLEAGVRSVRIDPVYFFDNMRVCHASGDAVRLCGAFSPMFSLPFDLTPGRLYAYPIRELADWLDRHPSEVVVLLVNNFVWPDKDAERNGALLAAPVVQYIGRDRVFTPKDLGPPNGTGWATTNVLPTVGALRAAGKQLVILGTRDFFSEAGDRLTFHGGQSHCRTNSLWSLWGASSPTYQDCNNDAQPAPSPSFPTCWGDLASNGTANPGIFTSMGEDRTASVTIAPPVDFMNAPEVRNASRCGVSIVNVDFLLNQGDSIQPAWGPKPDMGEDRRREAMIWSFDEGDYGSNGPAVMKPNGRWTSDPSTASHHFACVVKFRNADGTYKSTGNPWPYPHTYNSGFGKIKISTLYGSWSQGQAICEREYGMDFFAPATGPENELLAREYNTINGNNGLPYGNNGVWLNYVSTHGNLLSTSTPDLAFSIDIPDGAAPSQQIRIFGPPGATVAAPAVTAPTGSTVFLQNPGGIVFDSNGVALVTIALKSDAGVNRAPGIYANRIQYLLPGSFSPTGSNNSVISQLLINVILFAQGKDTLTLSASNCCNLQEGVAARLSLVLTRPKAAPTPFIGNVEIRRLGVSADGAPEVTRLTTPVVPDGLFLPGVGYLSAIKSFNLILDPGTHQLGAYFSGGPADSPATSDLVTINVAPFLNPVPAAVSLRLNPTAGPLPSSAATITINNPQNLSIAAIPNCGGALPACWLRASGSGAKVTLTYDPSAAQLAAGTYNATVQIGDGKHAKVLVPVSLTVVGSLTITPSRVEISASSLPVPFEVTGAINGFPVPLELRPGDGSPWLRVEQGRFVADPTGLAPGTYNGTGKADSPFAERGTEIAVRLQVTPAVTVGTSPAGLPFTVDGSTYTSPQIFAWPANSLHTISVPTIAPNPAGGNFLFARWNDNGAATHQVTAPATVSQSWTATFDAAYPLTAATVPVAGGRVDLSPAPEQQGLYRSGTKVTVTATPATGYAFTGFVGDLSGIDNPQSLTLTGPRTFTAKFAQGTPSLLAIAGATDASATAVNVALQLLNRGSVPATGVRILSVTAVKVLAGSGAVTPLVQTASLGSIAPGATVPATVSFTWPATATRIQFTVNFSDASGYHGSTTLAIFR